MQKLLVALLAILAGVLTAAVCFAVLDFSVFPHPPFGELLFESVAMSTICATLATTFWFATHHDGLFTRLTVSFFVPPAAVVESIAIAVFLGALSTPTYYYEFLGFHAVWALVASAPAISVCYYFQYHRREFYDGHGPLIY